MKRMTYFVMALALVLGFTQCKKEQIKPQGEQVTITLDVNKGNNGSRVNVTGPDVTFTQGDQILVAHDGKYVGTLTYTDQNHFEGNITAEVANPAQKLYFYFLGNKQDDTSLTEGTTTSCTVNISDQTGYPSLPVISFSESNRDFDGGGSYSAVLQNKASLMKFNVTTSSDSPVCIAGMNNTVTVKFDDRSENDGFSYGKADAEGVIKMKGGAGTEVEKWVIVLQHDAYEEEGIGGTVYTEDISYVGCRPELPAIDMDEYFDEGIDLTVSEDPVIDLSTITESTPITVGNHRTLSGTIGNTSCQVNIADGAIVTLNNVKIDLFSPAVFGRAGLTCLGDATITLEGENTIKGYNYPGIKVPGSGKTLTINGTGSLTAYSEQLSPAIGTYMNNSGGNIIIESGNITATGGIGGSVDSIRISGGTIVAQGQINGFAAIGSGYNGACGDINITGGTITATGGAVGGAGAGIGSGYYASCGAIKISGASTVVNATGGSYDDEHYYGAGIGSGCNNSSCGTITINGGTVSAKGKGSGFQYGAAGIGTGNNSSSCSDIIIGGDIIKVTVEKSSMPSLHIGKGTNSNTRGDLYIDGQNCGQTTMPGVGDIGNSGTLTVTTKSNTQFVVERKN